MEKKYIVVFDDGRKNLHIKAETILKALEKVGDLERVTMIALNTSTKKYASSGGEPDDPFEEP